MELLRTCHANHLAQNHTKVCNLNLLMIMFSYYSKFQILKKACPVSYVHPTILYTCAAFVNGLTCHSLVNKCTLCLKSKLIGNTGVLPFCCIISWCYWIDAWILGLSRWYYVNELKKFCVKRFLSETFLF